MEKKIIQSDNNRNLEIIPQNNSFYSSLSSFSKRNYSFQDNNIINMKEFKKNLRHEHLKQLNEYRNSLDKTIEILKEKLEKKNILTSNTHNNNLNTIKSSFPDIIESEQESYKTKLDYNNFNEIILNNKKIFLRFISLLNSNDLFRLYNINKEIHKIILNTLILQIKKTIIPKFIEKYKELFKENKFFLIIKKTKRDKKMHIRIYLSIKSTINDNNKNIVNYSYQIINESKNEETILNVYNFEIIPKNKPKIFWIIKEYTAFHYDEQDRAYFSNKLQFSPNDSIFFNVNIFTEIGLINFSTFHWIKYEKFKIKNLNYKLQNEIEYLHNGWNDINDLSYKEIVNKNINKLFNDFFDIKNIFFDDVGYYIFKIIMKAKKKGICQGIDNNIGISINIFDKEEVLENEAKKNNLVFDENNEININIDDEVIFYITQNK